MQELAGKLSALEPEVSAAITAVTYFDGLITNGVGLDGLLRGAAALAGTVAAAERRGRLSRFDPQGEPVTDAGSHPRQSERETAHGSVWLERDGDPLVTDALIVERLAFAVNLWESRGHDTAGFATVIDSGCSIAERSAVLARLRIDPERRVRVLASKPEESPSGPFSAVVPTRFGMLRATLDTGAAAPFEGRLGEGEWVRADHAPDSWAGAVIAYRLTTDFTPVVPAVNLGALGALAQNVDFDHPHPDVTTLMSLDPRSQEVLRMLVEQDSIRSAAAELGMHHSTLQVKHDQLSETLGYDPRSLPGRLRYMVAEVLRRIAEGG